MSPAVDRVLAHFSGAQKRGHGWIATCPAHDDRKASLSIDEGDGGRVLIHCHAGCKPEAILAKVGLTMGDLYPHPKPAPPSRSPHTRTIVRAYDYRDKAGTLRYQTVRTEPKDFFQRRPDGTLGWINNMAGIEPLPFRLPELSRSRGLVIVAEGEEDVFALESLGFTATTNHGGAGKWRAELSSYFAKRDVAVIPDNDQSGIDHARKVAASLHGIARSIKVLDPLPGVDPKGDPRNWIQAGGTAHELQTLIDAAPEWSPDLLQRQDRGQAEIAARAPTAAGPTVTVEWFADVTPKAIDWIWPRWLAKGKLHLLAGVGGIGKGTITAALASQLSTGTGTLPDGTAALLIKTLFLLSEDAADDTLWPRLDIHGADKRNVAHIAAITEIDGSTGMLDLARHLPALEDAINEHGIGLVVIDALSDFMPGSNRNSEGEVRDILTPLAKMAERTGVAVLGVMHPGKGNQDLRAFQRILGASAFGNVARSVWLAVESPDGDGHHLLGVDKSNLAIIPPTLVWSRAEDRPICWHGESPHKIGAVFGGSTARPRDNAEGFLRELLGDGPLAQTKVRALAEQAGLSWGTVRRAKDEIGVKSNKVGGPGEPQEWQWQLPDESPAGTAVTASEAKVRTPQDAQVRIFAASALPEPKVRTSQNDAHLPENPNESAKVSTALEVSASAPPKMHDTTELSGEGAKVRTLESRAVRTFARDNSASSNGRVDTALSWWCCGGNYARKHVSQCPICGRHQPSLVSPASGPSL